MNLDLVVLYCVTTRVRPRRPGGGRRMLASACAATARVVAIYYTWQGINRSELRKLKSSIIQIMLIVFQVRPCYIVRQHADTRATSAIGRGRESAQPMLACVRVRCYSESFCHSLYATRYERKWIKRTKK